MLDELELSSQVQLSTVQHKHFKEETENLEAPGQFLRHYSPDIDSYLFTDDSTKTLDKSSAVFLDFGGLFSHLKDQVKYYQDMSSSGDYLEAISVLYDVLRWAETKQDATLVLITNFKGLETKLTNTIGLEHRDALFDRVYRATSGKEL